MTKSKNTKRALLASVLSVMLCVVMLIGSTFAWFTDSVTNGKNKIVAGNLDVELYHTNGSVSNEKVQADTKMFVNNDGSDILWEPGVMVYENLTVKNVGSLALKYCLKINAVAFNTVKDTDKSLMDVLKVAILDDAFTGDRAAAQALKFEHTLADFERNGNIAAKAEDDTYAIVIYWEPSDVDNDYNLNNGKVSSDGQPLFIDLGMDLVATQDTVEKDSFDDLYDANAEYPDLDSSESDRPFTFDLTSTSPSDGEIQFITETAETAEGCLFDASIDGLQPSDRKYSFIFPIKGTSDKDMKLTFDFKSFKDVYARAGNYKDYNNKDFQLVGDYWPVTVNVAHTKGDAIDFTFTGTLTELVEKLSETPLVLKAGTVYDEEFTVTVSWPFETAATDDCYVLNSKNQKEELMDLADTLIVDWEGEPTFVGNELYAEFEVKLQNAN